MADRCHMQVTCAAADERAFRALGFRPVERRGAVVIMEDPAAPQAHDGDLPWHAVYYGNHGPGVHFDGAMFACDGQCFASVAVGRSGGVVVQLESDGSIFSSDHEEWLRYVALRRRVTAVLAQLESQADPTPLSPPLEELKRQATLVARDDPWIMEMIQQSAREWVASIQGSLSRELTKIEIGQLISAYRTGHFQSEHPREIVSEPSPDASTYEI